MSKVVYEIVTEKMIEKLNAGIVPWRTPWRNGVAVNWATQKPYRGINTFLLEPGEYATYKKVKEAGGNVKKGEKGQLVVFWNWVEKPDKETGEIEKIPFLKYYKVFNIVTQCEGLESKRPPLPLEEEEFEHDAVGACENIIDNYINKPELTFASGKAFYSKSKDLVSCPPLKDFSSVSEFYCTLFHELVHSTGHGGRLNRKELLEQSAFGDEQYSKEELTAEMGAAMLCAVAGVDTELTFNNSAAYIQSWLTALKNDMTLVVKAATAAQKAADHIQGITFKGE